MSEEYVHGYEPSETKRLHDQAATLRELLHADTLYPAGSRVLEAGCGVGAQTAILAAQSPEAVFTAVDPSATSLAEAKKTLSAAARSQVTFQQADIFALPFPPASFDHVFVCFVLEHLPQPLTALAALRQVLTPNGTITLIEGDHGSAFFHPESAWARRVIACQAELQARAGGNASLGRTLYPLLQEVGFASVQVSPRLVYADASQPGLREGFTQKTFTAMIEGIRQSALEAELISAADFDRGVADLSRTAEADGVFCYTFFKARAVNPSSTERR